MYLIINTIEEKKTVVGLARNEREFWFESAAVDFRQSEQILPLLDKILKKRRIKVSEIKGVIVVSGPGSFSAARSGVIFGNAFGFALNISVVGIKKTEFKNSADLIKQGIKKLKVVKKFKIITPLYDGEPNIGIKKHKS